MSSTFYPTRRATRGSARQWLIGGGTALVVGAAVALAVTAQPRAVAPVASPSVVAPTAAAVSPIEGYAVEGAQGYEWWAKSATAGYAVVEGPFGYDVVGPDAASAPAIGGLVAVRGSSGDLAGATFRLVAPEDGSYDEGPQGYEWRPRTGR
jgi:hypothetical protein